MGTPYCVVLITAPKGAQTKRIAHQLVSKRLAACVNVMPSVQSTYWWKGKSETAGESLLMVKTKKALLKKLIAFVQKIHPYTVPEVIAVPIINGHKPYLSWIQRETLTR